MLRVAALIRLALLYLFVSSVALLTWVSYEHAPGALIVAFLDVGQGDAIYIESPTGRQVLIDGGKSRDVLAELSRVMPLFDRSIDILINTHPDMDHIGGLPHVLERYHVAHVLDSGLEGDTEAFAFYAEELQHEIRSGALYHEARRGDVIDIGGGAYLRILFPDRDMASTTDANNASIVAQLVYGETEALLTGDAPKSVEEYLVLLDGDTLESAILKAGHHGSKTSSAEGFVRVVRPQYAVISAGCDNSYGHPHKEVVKTFAAASSAILSTCEHGTIVFKSDGADLILKK
ncbi:MAG TPA: MBL fold metallo-hydrolase [Candidatus Paceibacterota bacterium]|nr:MBL fold metallo-hydrolase [Candidatus Paceibacterota bacterium]